jgi:hypothetical protein
MTVESNSKPASATASLCLEWLAFPKASTAASGNLMTSWPEYMVDAFQRSVLFLDLLRQRGNQEIEITSRPMATVLRFDHEVLMSGRSLQRPINYALSRIVPPPGVATDPRKRPVVVVDPRAGQGPGIGGFKAESEIGDALNAGHPVYFIGFGATPAPGQQFLDVVEGQVKFFERVVELHPDAPRPFAIGNCQAGYQTLMVAMLRPDLFGPCLVAGSPMSYWQGVHIVGEGVRSEPTLNPDDDSYCGATQSAICQVSMNVSINLNRPCGKATTPDTAALADKLGSRRR